MATINTFTRLEIDTAPLTNLLKNHSARYGLWLWTAAGAATYNSQGFILTNASSTLTSEKVPVTAGRWVGLTGYGKTIGAASKGFTAKIRYYNVSNVIIGSAVQIAGPIIGAAGASFSATTSSQAPVGAVTMTLELDTAGASAGVLAIKTLMLSTATTSGGANQAFPENWVNILGTGLTVLADGGNELRGVEDEIIPGVLTAVVTDVTLDPATSTSLKKGRPIRLQATASGNKGVWQGFIDTADTEYEDNKTGPIARRITIIAVDVVRALDNTPLPTTVVGAFPGQVAAAALAARLPTSDGSTVPDVGTGIEARDDSATATDWIRRACNTHQGAVWVDQFGEIQQRLKSSLGTSAAYTFSDDAADTGAIFYTAAGLNYGSRALVNELTVKRINVDEVEDGSKVYGPYAALDSQVDNHRVTDEVEITAGSPSALADLILPVFATPKIFPTEIKVNALDNLALVLAVQKYDAVRVKRSTIFDQVVRVLSIRHELSSTGGKLGADKWFTYFKLRPLETATAVTITDPPAGADTGPGDLDTGSGTGFPRISSRTRTATQTLTTSGTAYAVDYNGASPIADGITYNGSAEWVITRAGRYIAAASAGFTANATGTRVLQLQVNGTAVDLDRAFGTASGISVCKVGKPLKLAVGDLVRVVATQSSGGSLTITGTESETWGSLTYVGP